MCRSKSPDHAVIRSDLNGGQGIFELGSILALSGVSVAKVWAFEQQRFECIFAITEHWCHVVILCLCAMSVRTGFCSAEYSTQSQAFFLLERHLWFNPQMLLMFLDHRAAFGIIYYDSIRHVLCSGILDCISRWSVWSAGYVQHFD